MANSDPVRRFKGKKHSKSRVEEAKKRRHNLPDWTGRKHTGAFRAKMREAKLRRINNATAQGRAAMED